MSNNGTRYSEEFKQQIVELHHSGQPVLALSREYSVSTVSIYNWIKQLSPIEVSDNEDISTREYQAMKKRIAQLETENEILKKSYRHIRKKTIDEIVAFIEKYKVKYTVKLICKVLKFPRSTYYEALNYEPSNWQIEADKLKTEIR